MSESSHTSESEGDGDSESLPDLITCDPSELERIYTRGSIRKSVSVTNGFSSGNIFDKIVDCRPKLCLTEMRQREDFFIAYKSLTNFYCPPLPLPDPYEHNCFFWDRNYVKMPNCRRNKKYIKIPMISSKSFKLNWKIIERSLSAEINSFQNFNDAVMKYNENLRKFDFNALRIFLEDTAYFPEAFEIINLIRKMVLDLPNIITQSIPMLQQGENKTIFLSRKQVACLMANAFFCTFPRRSKINEEYQNYPAFNFSSLFSSKNSSFDLSLKIEKLKCIFTYFKIVLKNTKLNGVLTFQRQFLTDSSLPNWSESNKSFKDLKMEIWGTIETEGSGFAEVEFANKYVGGGVLNSGIFQEEIRFLLCPELIVSRLFTEFLMDEEALIVTGCAQFNKHQGYGSTFKWAGEFNEDWLILDDWGRLHKQIIIIDALEFNPDEKFKRYELGSIERDLTKAYAGFLDKTEYESGSIPAIATGKWGCGAFNGDPYLKCLIQLMAASETGRDLIIFTLNDNNLTNEMQKIFSLIEGNDLKIKDLYNYMKEHKYPYSLSDNYHNYINFLLDQIQGEDILVKIE